MKVIADNFGETQAMVMVLNAGTVLIYNQRQLWGKINLKI